MCLLIGIKLHVGCFDISIFVIESLVFQFYYFLSATLLNSFCRYSPFPLFIKFHHHSHVHSAVSLIISRARLISRIQTPPEDFWYFCLESDRNTSRIIQSLLKT